MHPHHCLHLASRPGCQAQPKAGPPNPQPFKVGYGAPGDQAFPGRKIRPGQSSVLGAATASLKISIPIFVIIVCLGGRPPGLLPSSLLRPPPPAVSPKNMPFSALSLAGVRTLCSRMRGLVYVPHFVCLCRLSGGRRESRQPGSQCVCPLESKRHACGVYLHRWEAGTKKSQQALG